MTSDIEGGDVDHKAEAERIMGLAHDNADQGNEWRSDHQMRRAQVHATLHAAEQQRIANLIAMFAMDEADMRDFTARGVIFSQVAAEITEGLGLA